jgi:transposase
MIRIEFSAEEMQALDYERYHHPHPRIQRKMEALWLKSQKLPHKNICKLTNISKHTLCSYLREYKEGGIEKLKVLNFYKPQSALADHAMTIDSYFRDHPPASVKEARDMIQALTGIQRSLTQVRHFLTALGMRPRKVGMLPAKGDAQKQEAFKKKSWSRD